MLKPAYKCIIGKSRTSQDFPLVGTQRSNYALASVVSSGWPRQIDI